MPTDYFGLAGHVIDGQFHVIEVAGEGGFSVVYRGQHLTLREPVAIKCLKLQTKSQDPNVVASFTQRFFDESRIMYRLSQGNLNIVRAITTNVTVAPNSGATIPYMVLEWLDGVSLSQELKSRRKAKTPPPPLHEVMDVFESAALAIAYAHSQGVVHRDVKPGNLFLHTTREGPRMKVLDFGMAKVLSPEAMGGLESAETLGGVTVLSPQYVTPEQLEKSYGPVGPWTDVYAFALILVEALTNRRARDAETFADLMMQITRSDAVPTPKKRGAILTDTVDRVFARALARDPKARQPDLGTFWRELREAASSKVEEEDLKTSVDSAPNLSGVEGGTALTMTMAMASAPKMNMSSTMPLSQRSVAPQVESKAPEISAARVAAIEAARPSVPVSAAPPQRQQHHAPRMQAKPAARTSPPASEETARIKSVAIASEKRSAGGRVMMVFLVLFVLLSLGASGLIFARMLL